MRSPINITEGAECGVGHNLSFRGSSITANCCSNNNKYWITKMDWDECGQNIILKKCMSAFY